MQAYLHISQLVDLRSEGPEVALRWWEKTTLRYRILVRPGVYISIDYGYMGYIYNHILYIICDSYMYKYIYIMCISVSHSTCNVIKV